MGAAAPGDWFSPAGLGMMPIRMQRTRWVANVRKPLYFAAIPVWSGRRVLFQQARRTPWVAIDAGILLTDMADIARWLMDQFSGAETEILLENYIFEGGVWPGQVLDILVAKARAGVRVHVTLDAIGSHGFPSVWISRLQAAGAHIHWYHRLRFIGMEHRLRRTHRRIIVVDGQWGAVGGFAFADAWLGAGVSNPPYRDALFACRGPIAQHLRLAFARHHPRFSAFARPLPDSGTIRPGPGVDWGKGRLLEGLAAQRRGVRRRFLAILRAARRELWIATPYFNPDPVVRRALQRAAQRGVDVRLLLAGRITDHPLLRFGIQAYYQPLMQAGVRIYEYQGAFLHGKYALADGHWCTVGSANLDFLSLWFNHELNIELRSPLAVILLRSLFVREFAHAQELAVGRWQRRPRWRRTLEWLLSVLDRWVQSRALGRRKY